VAAADPESAGASPNADHAGVAPSPVTGVDRPDAAPSAHIPAGRDVKGVTDSTIRVGFITYDTDATAAAIGAVGGTDVPVADPVKVARAVIDHINERGGIAGRTVEPVFHEVNAPAYAQASGRQQEQQQACAHWTEDEPVFAFSGYAMNDEVALECAATSHTVMIATSYQANPSEQRFRTALADVWYAPHNFVADHRERVVATGLVDQGFFGDGARVALLVEGQPDIETGVERGMKPVLAAAGVTPQLEIVYPDQIESPWQNYVLQLQTAGITHVVFSTTTGSAWPALFMMRAAESQRYRPYWGIGSDNSPCGVAGLGPAEQLVKTRGVGWQPPCDVNQTEPVSPNDSLCRDIVRPTGEVDTSGRATCEVLFFLRDALARAIELSPSGMSAALDSLGDDYLGQMTAGGATIFSRIRHDGPALMQPFTYDDRCGQDGAPCFAYTAQPRPVPA
jgi:hypothetical protein